MNERRFSDYSFLAAFAAAMALTIVITLLYAASAQNEFGWVTSVASYELDGTSAWSVALDSTGQAPATRSALLIPQESGVLVLDEDSSTALEIEVAGVERVLGDSRVVLVGTATEHGRDVVAFSADSGSELWRSRDRSLVRFDRDVALVAKGSQREVVESQTGRLIEVLPGSGVVVLENGAAATVNADSLIITTIAGTTELKNDAVAETTVAQIEPEAVVLYGKGNREGRRVIGIHRETGELLWSKRVRDYVPPQVSTFEIGRQTVLDAVTGEPTMKWVEADQDGGTVAYVDAAIELVPTSSQPTRLFWVDGGTVAVDTESNRVLWTRPGQRAAHNRGGIVRFEDGDRMELVDAITGESLANLRDAGRSEIRLDGGTALVADAGRITLVTTAGRVEQIDDVRPDAEVLATSEDYGVVVDGRTIDNVVLHVYDYNSGSKIIEEPSLATRAEIRSGARGDRVVITGGNRTIRISLDPASLGETAPAERPVRDYRINPSRRSVLVVLDAGQAQLLWDRPIADVDGVGVVGDLIVIAQIRAKHRPDVVPSHPQ